MGRAEVLEASPGVVASPRRRSGLSLIQGGLEPPSWTPTSLERLTRALDLRPTGFRRYAAAVPEARWPAFPAALLVASAVVAAERSLPGTSVGHLSCSFGPLPRAGRPVEVALSEVHQGETRATGRLTFRQGAVVHGEATVMLRSLPARPTGPVTARPATRPASTATRRPATAVAEWDLRDARAADELRPTGDSRVWSRLPGAAADGTLQRALLAYLSELLPVNVAGGPRYPGQPGPSATVLSHAVTFCAQFDLGDWLLATVQSAAPGEGYVHALATFRNQPGQAVATVSQAVAVPVNGTRLAPVQHMPTPIRYGSQ
jgi:hypothetical protein